MFVPFAIRRMAFANGQGIVAYLPFPVNSHSHSHSLKSSWGGRGVRTVFSWIEVEGRRCEECVYRTLAASSFLFLICKLLMSIKIEIHWLSPLSLFPRKESFVYFSESHRDSTIALRVKILETKIREMRVGFFMITRIIVNEITHSVGCTHAFRLSQVSCAHSWKNHQSCFVLQSFNKPEMSLKPSAACTNLPACDWGGFEPAR